VEEQILHTSRVETDWAIGDLLELSPGRGAVVRKFSAKDVQELKPPEIRSALPPPRPCARYSILPLTLSRM